MPVFTHFTFNTSTKWSKNSSQPDEETEGRREIDEPYISFSGKLTAANILISIASYGLLGATMSNSAQGVGDLPLLIFTISGMLLTALILALTLCSSSSCCSCNCCCKCCINPAFESGALVPSQPHEPFVLDGNGKLKAVAHYDQVELKELNTDQEGAKKVENPEGEMAAKDEEDKKVDNAKFNNKEVDNQMFNNHGIANQELNNQDDNNLDTANQELNNQEVEIV